MPLSVSTVIRLGDSFPDGADGRKSGYLEDNTRALFPVHRCQAGGKAGGGGVPPSYKTECSNRHRLPANYRRLPPNRRPLPPNRRPLPPNYGPFPPNRRPLPPKYRPLPPNRRPLPPKYGPFPPNRRPLPPKYRPLPPNRRPSPPNGCDNPCPKGILTDGLQTLQTDTVKPLTASSRVVSFCVPVERVSVRRGSRLMISRSWALVLEQNLVITDPSKTLWLLLSCVLVIHGTKRHLCG